MIIPHVGVKRNREKKSYPQKMQITGKIYPYIVDNTLKIKHYGWNFQKSIYTDICSVVQGFYSSPLGGV